jgi:hypothetical protein
MVAQRMLVPVHDHVDIASQGPGPAELVAPRGAWPGDPGGNRCLLHAILNM